MQQIRRVKDFPKPGIDFIDIQSVLIDPNQFQQVIDEMEQLILKKLDGVSNAKLVALESRGFIFASALARQMKLPLVLARKKGKLPPPVVSKSYDLEYGEACIELSRYAVKEGDNCIIIDDVLATGGTIKALESLISELGANSVTSILLAEIEELGGRHKLESDVKSLLIF